MKIELRKCNECNRETLMVEKTECGGGEAVGYWSTRVWYCPFCGNTWLPVKQEKDTLVTG